MLAVWTTEGVLSVVLPAAASIGLIVGGVVMRRSSSGQQIVGSASLLLGVLGLLVSAGWLILALYVEANVR
jgi:proteasome assembly chaperone (PAC2) family protein